MLKCFLCDCEIDDEEEYAEFLSDDGVTMLYRHDHTMNCVDALVARAEAAEAEVAALKAQLATEHEAACANAGAVMEIAGLLGIPDPTPDLTRKTIKALKAQLAAQWRPVTEDEPPIGNRVILRHLPVIRLDADRWLNSDGIEFWHEDGAAVYWQPAPPQEAE